MPFGRIFRCPLAYPACKPLWCVQIIILDGERMKVFWGLGKLLTLLFWLVVLVNLLIPFVRPLHLLVDLAGSLLALAHLLELVFCNRSLTGRAHPWRDRLKIVFSAFSTCKPFRPRPLRRLPMRKLCLLAALISPLACAQVVSVETNSLMRLPNTASSCSWNDWKSPITAPC